MLVLIAGFVFATAQLLPSIPRTQEVARQTEDDDLGAVVDRMAKSQEQAAGTYARTRVGRSAAGRPDRGRLAARGRHHAGHTWLERVTAVLTRLLSIVAVRLLKL